MNEKSSVRMSFVEASLVNCMLAVLVCALKSKAGMVRTVASVLNSEFQVLQKQPSGSSLERLGDVVSSLHGYLTFMAVILVLSSAFYIIRSNSKRYFPAIALALSLFSLAINLIGE